MRNAKTMLVVEILGGAFYTRNVNLEEPINGAVPVWAWAESKLVPNDDILTYEGTVYTAHATPDFLHRSEKADAFLEKLMGRVPPPRTGSETLGGHRAGDAPCRVEEFPSYDFGFFRNIDVPGSYETWEYQRNQI